MNNRKGDFLVTRSGRRIYPLQPFAHELCIKDIAWGLSKTCRYGGHILCDGIYTVAQHCVMVSHLLPDALALTGLLHDGSESFLCDIIKPVKVHLPDYQALEARWETAIAQQFNLIYPYPADVKDADLTMFAIEVDALRPKSDGVHGSMQPPASAYAAIPAGFRLDRIWSPLEAYEMFLHRFCQITGQEHYTINHCEGCGIGAMVGNDTGHSRRQATRTATEDERNWRHCEDARRLLDERIHNHDR